MVQIPQKIAPLIIFSSIGLGLAGCSTYSKDFDCPYGQGLGCASISKVDRMIDENLINLDESISRPSGPSASKRQVHIYYGPNQPGKILTIDQLNLN